MRAPKLLRKRSRTAIRAFACLLLTVTILPWCLLSTVSPLLRAAMEVPIRNPGRVLLVTAHPDDETIFFSPTITALHSFGQEIFLLCLTTGNAHGLGRLRSMELAEASKSLHIDRQHLTVVDDDVKFKDGHNTTWDETALIDLVKANVARYKIETVITFDKDGVTGHRNHKSCYNSMRTYVSTCAEGTCPSAWALASTSRMRRYSSMLDVLPSTMEGVSPDVAFYLNRSIWQTYNAMFQHASQWRWWTHVMFTRYTFVNTLTRISSASPAMALRPMLAVA